MLMRARKVIKWRTVGLSLENAEYLCVRNISLMAHAWVDRWIRSKALSNTRPGWKFPFSVDDLRVSHEHVRRWIVFLADWEVNTGKISSLPRERQGNLWRIMLEIFYFLIMLISNPVYVLFLINHHRRKSHLTEKSFPSPRNKKIIDNIPSRQAIHSLPSKRIDCDSQEWIDQLLFFRIGEPRVVKTLIDSSIYRIRAAEDALGWFCRVRRSFACLVWV